MLNLSGSTTLLQSAGLFLYLKHFQLLAGFAHLRGNHLPQKILHNEIDIPAIVAFTLSVRIHIFQLMLACASPNSDGRVTPIAGPSMSQILHEIHHPAVPSWGTISGDPSTCPSSSIIRGMIPAVSPK